VGSEDGGIHDVGVRAGTGSAVVAVGGRARGAAGDGSETPGSASLGHDGPLGKLDVLGDLVEKGPDLVLLNVEDLHFVS
jgi:hypothetical protein